MAKRRTPAQIRATKKLVAMNRARGRKNPKKRGRSKSARQMKRAGKAVAKWVRSGMPSVRNKPKRKRNPEPKNKLVIINGKAYMSKGGSGRVIAGYGSTVMNRGKRKKNPKGGGSGRVISGYGSTVMNSGKPPKGFIKCKAVRVIKKGGKQILQIKR